MIEEIDDNDMGDKSTNKRGDMMDMSKIAKSKFPTR